MYPKWLLICRYLNAIHSRIPQLNHVADSCFNFSGANIFPPPTKCIAGAIFKIEPSKLVHDQDIAGAKTHVALAPNITNNFLFGCRLVGIAIKVADRMVFDNLTNEFARLSWLTANTETIFISDFMSSDCIDFYQSEG